MYNWDIMAVQIKRILTKNNNNKYTTMQLEQTGDIKISEHFKNIGVFFS